MGYVHNPRTSRRQRTVAQGKVDVGGTSPIGKESEPIEGTSAEYPMRTKSSGAARMMRNVLIPSSPNLAYPRYSACNDKEELVKEAGRFG